MSSTGFRPVIGNNISDTLSSSISAGASSIPVNNISLWGTGIGKVIVDRGTTNQQIFLATGVSGSSLTVDNTTTYNEGTSQIGHNAGATIESVPTAGDWNDQYNALIAQHNSDGTHKSTLVTTLKASAAEVATGTDDTKIVTPKGIKDATGITLTSPVLNTPTIVTPVIRNYDGWIDANETWTYASANTITVPSGAASKYAVGDRIKWTQTTVKYGVITAVADTLLTIAVNTDYVVTNAAISANYYSHEVNPMGYPQIFNFTPSITYAGGSGPTTASVVERYSITGKEITYWVTYTITTIGSGNAVYIIMSIPLQPANSSYGLFQLCHNGIVSSQTTGIVYHQGTPSVALVVNLRTSMNQNGEADIVYKGFI
jgi:hypothetical protein